jgi:hypothetical protein
LFTVLLAVVLTVMMVVELAEVFLAVRAPLGCHVERPPGRPLVLYLLASPLPLRLYQAFCSLLYLFLLFKALFGWSFCVSVPLLSQARLPHAHVSQGQSKLGTSGARH